MALNNKRWRKNVDCWSPEFAALRKFFFFNRKF